MHVRTDVLDVTVSLAGGELERADLPAYPQAKNTPDAGAAAQSRQRRFAVRGAERSRRYRGEQAPTHRTLYTADVQELHLGPTQSELRLPLHWSDGHGVTVTKTLIFHRGQYRIGLEYEIHNGGSAPWSFAPYEQILRYNTPVERSYFRVDSYAFKGPAISDGKKYPEARHHQGREARSERHRRLDRRAAAAFPGGGGAAERCSLSL